MIAEPTIDMNCIGCGKLIVVPLEWKPLATDPDHQPINFVCETCFFKGEQWLKEKLLNTMSSRKQSETDEPQSTGKSARLKLGTEP